MDYKQVAKRMNDEIDRLSNLPDDLIHKILSFVGIKRAIELSALSSRWRYIWTSMPHLNFFFKDFYTSNFVTHLVSRRNNLIEVFSIKLCFDECSSKVFVEQVLKYAFSHNVQQLDIIWFDGGSIESPLSLIRSESLTHLSMIRKCFTGRGYCVEDVQGSFNVVNVVAPQLKNLTIDNGPEKYQYLISAPRLVSLLYKGHHCLDLSTDGISLLEKVDLCVCGGIASAYKIVCLFQHLRSVKYLTLNLEILELLSSSVELILINRPPFANLKSLHIYPVEELSEVRNDVEMSSEVKNYLLENSPSATFTMVSRECANLKNLTLKSCKVIGLNGLNIRHPLLSNLTVEDVQGSFNVVNVVAPQLKNLTIDNGPEKYQYLISAPRLVSLLYKGHHCLDLSTDGISLLEKVDLCVCGGIASAYKIVCLFQHLRSVKYLTLNLEILELLSSSVELILINRPPFANLKSLHIYPVEELSEVRNDVEMSSEVKNYLLENSPSATFTMVSREESRVRKDTKLAQNQMASLQLMLEHEKTKMENQITQVENLLQIGERMTHVNRCWEGLSDRIEQGKQKTDDIIAQLRNIKKLMTKLPASKRAEMEPCFSSLAHSFLLSESHPNAIVSNPVAQL
ncbi:F-box domain, Leucine-rich repeat domain, L domain-like protein [Artemisia annua]|uniref:F-box domain, Leucine-rich repeat domain, L domain-like protein n=1 Tax=Artemisia annua TaxID=35608 RepID=A0A2U1QK13_ARTAN|nr:F-box domain, Leucine-rich repeat domain, L domain-like protein [Artemisia annua]